MENFGDFMEVTINGFVRGILFLVFDLLGGIFGALTSIFRI